MKKNEIYPTRITGLSNDGNGVGRVDGMAVFVPFAAVGDEILVKAVKIKKNFAFGIIEKIIKASPDRIPSGKTSDHCAIYGKCGGCKFRHITYEAELKAKHSFVSDAFLKIGGIGLPIENIKGSEKINYYRNKMQLPVGINGNGEAVSGFFAERSHRIVPLIPCGECKLQPEIFAKIINIILKWIKIYDISIYDEKNHKNLIRHIYLRYGEKTGEIMVCLISTNMNIPRLDKLTEMLSGFENISSIVVNVNNDKNNIILGKKNILIRGKPVITDILHGIKIELSPNSFYQINRMSAETLYETVEEFAEFSGNEILIDLYCGTGSIGLGAAGKVNCVIGVEIIKNAVDNAKRNAEINNIENAEFVCADAEQAAAAFAEKGLKPDIIITDPPRKGCSEGVLASIIKMSPEKVIMISCNPATAARDCKYLSENGYEIGRIKPIDMFPRTPHVECVVLMTRKDG